MRGVLAYSAPPCGNSLRDLLLRSLTQDGPVVQAWWTNRACPPDGTLDGLAARRSARRRAGGAGAAASLASVATRLQPVGSAGARDRSPHRAVPACRRLEQGASHAQPRRVGTARTGIGSQGGNSRFRQARRANRYAPHIACRRRVDERRNDRRLRERFGASGGERRQHRLLLPGRRNKQFGLRDSSIVVEHRNARGSFRNPGRRVTKLCPIRRPSPDGRTRDRAPHSSNDTDCSVGILSPRNLVRRMNLLRGTTSLRRVTGCSIYDRNREGFSRHGDNFRMGCALNATRL